VKIRTLDITFGGQSFTLLQEKAVYWNNQKTLLIADVHAGKASHFRSHGIPLSTDHLLHDLNIILELIEHCNCEKVIFLGDLYHTHSNIENKLIDSWLNELNVSVELIIGNHDRHSISGSDIANKESYVTQGILLSHEPAEIGIPNICGHLHPAYNLYGKGRQQLKLPAFYFATDQLILPAFGSVNGRKMYPDLVKKSQVILVSEEGLIQV
jgi:DNA ligase-associated metallophosphoesterase